MKNVIKCVEEGSPLFGKVQRGYELLSINGNLIRDVLDYKYFSYESRLLLEFRTPEGKIKLIRLRKPEGLDLGLEFETYLMDRPRSCANRCVFCFIDQNPAGMRKSIYFKDDDARLSFLMGCYITLTNLSQREIQRIIDLRISPVNISVHTTDPELRVKMLQNKRAGEVMELMQRFAEAGITMNCQIVCCPGINDGAALQRSLEDLRSLYPAVNSVSVVPLGLTKHRAGLPCLQPFTAEHAGETIDLVEAFGEKCLASLGTRLAFCADELYIKAGRTLPEDAFYEAHTQLENGVGMIRLLHDEVDEALSGLEGDGRRDRFSLATGLLAAPHLRQIADQIGEKYPGLVCRVFPVRNDFFGERITVSGLLTGKDLIAQLRGKDLGSRLLLPCNMLRSGEEVFLDDITVTQLQKELNIPVQIVSADGAGLVKAFLEMPEGKDT